MTVKTGHIRRWEREDYAEQLLGTHWGLIPALLAAPGLAQLGNPAGAWLVLLAAIMASYDVAVRRIPNQINALTALCGLALSLGSGWEGLSGALLGGLAGLGLMGLFYLFGAVGAGDVKAMAALSTFLGPLGAVYLFATTAIAGGVLAALRMVCSSWRPGPGGGLFSFGPVRPGLTLPYGVAILAGTIWTVFLRGTLS